MCCPSPSMTYTYPLRALLERLLLSTFGSSQSKAVPTRWTAFWSTSCRLATTIRRSTRQRRLATKLFSAAESNSSALAPSGHTQCHSNMCRRGRSRRVARRFPERTDTFHPRLHAPVRRFYGERPSGILKWSKNPRTRRLRWSDFGSKSNLLQLLPTHDEQATRRSATRERSPPRSPRFPTSVCFTSVGPHPTRDGR
jgi:hypothetical protein